MSSAKRVGWFTIAGITLLMVLAQQAVSAGPFGSFETPINGSTVRGTVMVTGWALDDVAVASVRIYRMDGTNLIYIADAALVEGARPDVATAYPYYPHNRKAGWAYSLVTNFLPDGGNSSYTLYVTATDNEGNTVPLGTRTIHCDNNNAVKPFGTFDTPAHGSTVSGIAYMNWGWVLTPQPNTIPTDGSTIHVYIDGALVGHPNYNIYRADLASLLPGFNNSNGAGASFTFDTTSYSDGVHTIQWTATDNAGNSDGIGGRYFTIQNGPPVTAPAVTTAAITAITATTASGGGNVTSDGGDPVTERGVCWSTSEHPLASFTDKTTDGTGTGSFTSTLTGLAPGTTYYVRAYAVNGRGTSYGNDVTFTVASIPTLTEWGIIIMAILLLGSSLRMMRGKRHI